MRNYTRRTNVPFSWDVLVARNTTQLSSPHETGILARSAFSRILTKLVKYLRSTSAGGRAPKSRGFRYWRPSAHAVYNNSQNQAFEGGCFNHLSRLLGSPDPRLFGALGVADFHDIVAKCGNTNPVCRTRQIVEKCGFGS